MKKLLKPLMTLLAVICLSGPVMAADAPVVGQAAPDFTATDIDGNAVKLSGLKDKIVVLEWHNPGCPFVVKHYETTNMQKLQSEVTAKDVVWLSINSSAELMEGNLTDAKAHDYIKTSGAKPTHYILDSKGELGNLYQAKTTPHMFVIGKDGVLAYAGAIDDTPTPRHEGVEKAKNYVRAAVDALIAGKPVEVATSQPYGCGVKYSTK